MDGERLSGIAVELPLPPLFNPLLVVDIQGGRVGADIYF